MSVQTVQNAVLNLLQKNTALDAEFTTALTGTASSSGVDVTGVGTVFDTELSVNDYIGMPAKGYRKVAVITSSTALKVESAFDNDLSSEAIKKTQIQKGLGKNVNLTEVGKLLRISFVASSDVDDTAPGKRVRAVYGFVVVVGFYETDEISAEERKSTYDQLIRNAIDNDPTFGGVCLGITQMGRMQVAESPDVDGVYYGVLPLICFKHETRGAR